MFTPPSSPIETKNGIRRWSFEPEPRKGRKNRIRREKSYGVWVAPEHGKIASQMQRDWPRNDRGEPIRDERGRVLVIDKRPKVMIPPRKTYIGFK